MAITIKRAEKYGFCAGVRIADRKVKKYAQEARTGGHILGQVVHNERVVEEMEQLGVHTVHGMGEVDGGTIIFSAHGVPPSFHDQARARGLNVLDTTCPFVYDIHDEAAQLSPRARIWCSSAIPSTARSSATLTISTLSASMC